MHTQKSVKHIFGTVSPRTALTLPFFAVTKMLTGHTIRIPISSNDHR